MLLFSAVHYPVIGVFSMGPGRVFFLASDFSAVMAILSSMFAFHSAGAAVVSYFDMYTTLLVVALLFAAHRWMRNHTLASRLGEHQHLLGICRALMLILIAQGSGEQFVYFQF